MLYIQGIFSTKSLQTKTNFEQTMIRESSNNENGVEYLLKKERQWHGQGRV